MQEYGNPPVGSARNNWWLFTYADYTPSGQSPWGWFPATKISGGANYQPEPGLPTCNAEGVYPLSFT